MYKEKFYLIINKGNQMNKYFAEDVYVYILLKSALIRVYRTVLHQDNHSLITASTIMQQILTDFYKAIPRKRKLW